MDPLPPTPPAGGPPPVSPIVPTPLPPVSSNLALKVLVGIATVAVLTAGGYLAVRYIAPAVSPTLSPTSDPTADWKTYRNEQYGFEFKYPAEWKMTLNSDNNRIFAETGVAGPWPFVMQIINNTSNQTVESYILNDPSHKDFPYEIVQRNYRVDSATGVKVRDPITISDTVYTVIFPFSNYLFKISGIGTGVPKLDQILSTFKFTTPSIPADWKTYRNEEYGFEVKYPSTARISGPFPAVSSGFSIDINYEGREGYEPPRLALSTFKDTRPSVTYRSTNTFTGNEGENPIQSVLNGRTMLRKLCELL